MPSPSIRQVFADNLRRLRQEQGLSQEALAYESGIDRTYVSALERQLYSVSIDVLEQLGVALGVPAMELLRPSEKRPRR